MQDTDAGQEMTAPPTPSEYTVQKQHNRTWSIFLGTSLLRDGFMFKENALAYMHLTYPKSRPDVGAL